MCLICRLVCRCPLLLPLLPAVWAQRSTQPAVLLHSIGIHIIMLLSITIYIPHVRLLLLQHYLSSEVWPFKPDKYAWHVESPDGCLMCPTCISDPQTHRPAVVPEANLSRPLQWRQWIWDWASPSHPRKDLGYPALTAAAGAANARALRQIQTPVSLRNSVSLSTRKLLFLIIPLFLLFKFCLNV